MEASPNWASGNVQSLNIISGLPKNPRENMTWRRKMLLRAKVDLEYREKCRELFFRSPLFAFNAFFYTYDPRKRPFHDQPFCTYDYEDELISELVVSIDEGSDIAVEKTRDMGVTWSVLGVYVWFWLQPIGGADFLVGSRIEDYVDKKGDPRTHFERMRYTVRRLPKWLLPKGWNARRDDNYMKLINPYTGSAITGESNNANFSTQGRYRSILYDEFAKWENTDEKAWTAGGDATPSRIAVSTPFGVGGQYYRVVSDGKTKVLRYHWARHPEKARGISCVYPPPNEDDRRRLGSKWKPRIKLTSPWYEKECKRRRGPEIAQELDINYLGAGNPVFVDQEWDAIEYYHALNITPHKWYKPDLSELTASEVSKPEDHEGYIGIIKEYDTKLTYVIAADICEGKEDGDFAVCKIMCRETKGIVATYFSKFDEILMAKVIYIMSNMYSPEKDSYDAPWTAIETNGPGLATFNEADRLGVNNLFMMPRYDISKEGVSYKKGWRTDAHSRSDLIAGIRKWLLISPAELDIRCVGELMSFVYSRTGKPQAKGDCNDDEVITFGILIQVDEIAPYEGNTPKTEEDIKKIIQHPEEHAKEVKELSIEELCYLTASRRRDAQLENEIFFRDMEVF